MPYTHTDIPPTAILVKKKILDIREEVCVRVTMSPVISQIDSAHSEVNNSSGSCLFSSFFSLLLLLDVDELMVVIHCLYGFFFPVSSCLNASPVCVTLVGLFHSNVTMQSINRELNNMDEENRRSVKAGRYWKEKTVKAVYHDH